MRIRKKAAILGTSFLVGGFLFIYLLLEEPQPNLDGAPQADFGNLEQKLKNLESDLEQNANIISDLKVAVKNIVSANKKNKIKTGEVHVNKTLASVNRLDGVFAQTQPSTCDIQMEKVYDKLEFDNPDGGVWKQGWDINYKEDQWDNDPLQVFIVPHSHNDPGWIKTFESYYKDQTNKILSMMVKKLVEFPTMKFIWAEISYLSLWWAEQNPEVRSTVHRLLEEERLEIVTGGWVMPDEASTHYTAMLEQLIHGHEWCHQNLQGYQPNSGWSIDPFGMSPTMSYILKRAGLDNMLIQRTHYSVKKKLAKDKNLEFNWRQHWDHNSTSDMFCHMMPFYSYDVPHTCGPDPKICCQFDFLRLPGSRASCPWNVPPRKISAENVESRSLMLLDQYRKKSTLYRSNVVLIPLGDDFRWDGEKEWNDQYTNYQMIIDHVNSNPRLNAKIQWGTLTDYFKAVRAKSLAKTGDETRMFPTLSGDFFTYADRDDHYWSGYFTSRPFWKSMNRILEHYLRGAEILFSLSWAEMEYIGSDKTDLAKECIAKLVYARQSLGLFQHHDGITGTAKDHVVLDYGQKMLLSIKAMQFVIQQSTNFLLTTKKPNYTPRTDTAYFDLDDLRSESWSIPKKTVIDVDNAGGLSRLVIYNSQARKRQEMVTVRVSSHNIKVYMMSKIEDEYQDGGREEEEEVELPCQISPVFIKDGEISNSEYELTFLANVPALALETYFLRGVGTEESRVEELSVPTVRIINSDKEPYQIAPFSSVTLMKPEPFTLANTYLKAKFGSTGLLEGLTNLDTGETTPTRLQFIKYGARSQGERSGAYLFLPDGPGSVVQFQDPVIRIVQGKLMSYVEVVSAWLTHRVFLLNSPGVDGTGLSIQNDIDLTSRRMDNSEISMRFTSGIDSKDIFYTDLNGFQMIRRKHYSKLPLQANWYPVATLMYIQDEKNRLSLVSRSPLGGSSLNSGELEIMLDRRLAQDDNRGLFQGVQDNKVTRHQFFLVLEKQVEGCIEEPEGPASYPSLLVLSIRHSILNPFFRLIYLSGNGNSLSTKYTAVHKDLDCDIHLINLRTMTFNTYSPTPSDKSALIIHRQGFNSCYKPVGLTCQTSGGKVSLDEMFPTLYSSSVNQVSLSLMYEGMKMEKAFTVSIQPMEMYSFILSR
ncbi:alpha-mannosidase 2 isoform X2 [Eurytemora carolleeae]|uniref:alpha-mannosidase 2 isoform X2 n=1 Tax=Eurytemora carolleeae TaxID=1294199 RepID=UPI000C77598B|nr:alpha-mannosidase 2 isoform X2 [Eurytemora carolleeae]|eukprot:XP_023340187.1 alpha-mannosidase 2-like isoform X2 [Eurytemora affinis]